MSTKKPHVARFCLIIAISTSGCGDSSKEDNKTEEPPIEEGKGRVSGVVTDQEGVPVEEVTIAAGSVSVRSDDTGQFSLDADPGAQVIRFSKKGYASSSLEVVVTEGADTPVQEGLAKRSKPITVDIEAGETIGEMARVRLTAGSLVSEDGTAATGDISAYITPIDITRDLTAAPGDFSAVAAGGDETRLETLGMAEYYFEDAEGNPLNVAEGAAVDIEIALPDVIGASVGDVIPAWYFDLETGRWVEEGEGEVAADSAGGLVWRATVSHFSWWNADVPIEERDCIVGEITDCNGKAVPGAAVTARGISYQGQSTAYPGESSGYCVDIKRGAEVDLLVVGTVNGNTVGKRVNVTGGDSGVSCEEGRGGCQVRDVELPCEAEESDLDCGESPLFPCKGCISGRVVSTDGAPIEDAIVSINNTIGGFGARGIGDDDGAFCLPAPYGAAVTLTVNAAGYPPMTEVVTASEKGACPSCTDVGEIVLDKRQRGGDTVFERCNETEISIDSVELDGADPVLAELPYVGMTIIDSGEGGTMTGYFWMSNSDDPDDPTGSSSLFVSFEVPSGAGAGQSAAVAGLGSYNAGGVFGVNSESYAVSTGTLTWNEAVEGAGQVLTGSWSFEMTTICGMALRTILLEGTFSTTIVDVWTYAVETDCMSELLRYYTGWGESTIGIATVVIDGEPLSSGVSTNAVVSPDNGNLSILAFEDNGVTFGLSKESLTFGTQDITSVWLSDEATGCHYEAVEVPELILEENGASDIRSAPLEGRFTCELLPALGDCTDVVSVSGTFISAICAQ